MSLVGIAALELQNRVHQFNSGRGLHLLYQLVRLNFGSAIEDEKYIHGPRTDPAASSQRGPHMRPAWWRQVAVPALGTRSTASQISISRAGCGRHQAGCYEGGI